MNNTFQIKKTNSSPISATSNSLNASNDKACFKETLGGIEKFWNDLNTDLEKKLKDKETLHKLAGEYEFEEIEGLLDTVEQEIDRIRSKLDMIQRVMWDVRSRILFTDI